MDLEAFAREHLPRPPARVLEVGCGSGDLTRAMAALGHDVLGIDPRAPKGELFEAVSLQDLEPSGPFDAVVASRSLHHIADLGGALDKVVNLLDRGGRVLVHEHAPDRMDGPTARWYLERRAASHKHTPSLHSCREEWEQDHADLHGYATLREQLDARFTERFFEWTPYLYGELGGGEEEEQALIDSGAIRGIGFLYVGETSRQVATG